MRTCCCTQSLLPLPADDSDRANAIILRSSSVANSIVRRRCPRFQRASMRAARRRYCAVVPPGMFAPRRSMARSDRVIRRLAAPLRNQLKAIAGASLVPTGRGRRLRELVRNRVHQLDGRPYVRRYRL